MDGCRARPSRAVIPQKFDQLADTTRPKLGLTEKKNGVPLVCNSRTREISSVYKSSTASPFIHVVHGRSQSPIVNSKSNVQELKLPRRSQSADKRRTSNSLSACSRPSTPSPKSSRPSTPANDSVTEMHSTPRRFLVGRTPDGLWPSMKSLSLSFGMNSSKNAVSERNGTPPQGRKSSDISENARPVEGLHGRTMDQSRMLGLRSRKISGNSSKSNPSITASRGVLHGRIHDSHVSDKGYKRTEIERRIALDSNGQSKRESCVSMSSHNLCSLEKTLPVTKPSRKNSSPLPRSHHDLPLIKTLSAPCPTSKEISGPFSASNSTKRGVCCTPSVLNYTVLHQRTKVQKGKQSTKRIEDAHQLHMLYNRYLQWRLVNALAEDVLSVQRLKAVTTLYDMENVSSELCDPFIQKRIYMQHMKQDMKLNML